MNMHGKRRYEQIINSHIFPLFKPTVIIILYGRQSVADYNVSPHYPLNSNCKCNQSALKPALGAKDPSLQLPSCSRKIPYPHGASYHSPGVSRHVEENQHSDVHIIF